MSSNSLYGLRKVETFVQLTGLPGRPVRQPVFAGCTWRLCDRRLWLVTKSALEVCIHDDALYKLTTFTFTFICGSLFFLRWRGQFAFHVFGSTTDELINRLPQCRWTWFLAAHFLIASHSENAVIYSHLKLSLLSCDGQVKEASNTRSWRSVKRPLMVCLLYALCTMCILL